MIVHEFLDMYATSISNQVFEIYKRKIGLHSRHDLRQAEWFFAKDKTAFAQQLDFFDAIAEIKAQGLWRQQGIIFDVPDNICFPFFIHYVSRKMLPEANTTSFNEKTTMLQESVSERNRLRRQFFNTIDPQIAQDLNEIVALQNFSSGGEGMFSHFFSGKTYPFRDKSILDAGCGSGFISLFMASVGGHVVGVDTSQIKINRGLAVRNALKNGHHDILERWGQLIIRENADYEASITESMKQVFTIKDWPELQHKDISNLGNNRFDLINLFDVIEHLPNPGMVLSAICTYLNPNGRVFVSAPTKYSGLSEKLFAVEAGQLFPGMLHFAHYSLEQLVNLFASFNMIAEEVTLFKPWVDYHNDNLELMTYHFMQNDNIAVPLRHLVGVFIKR